MDEDKKEGEVEATPTEVAETPAESETPEGESVE